MTDRPPVDESNEPQPRPAYAERRPSAEKRPVSVRARETAGTGYRAVRWAVLLVLAVIAAAFIVRNFERVPIDWVFGTSRVPLSLIMIMFLAIGFVIGWLVHWQSVRSDRRR